MLEVALVPFGSSLDAAEALGRRLHKSQLGACRGQVRCDWFEFGIDHLVGIEFGAVDGQVEDLDPVLVFGQPELHRPAVVHSRVAQDHVDLAVRVFDRPAQEVDPDVGVERADQGLPAHRSLVRAGGDHPQAEALLVVQPDRWALTLGRTTAAAHVVASQSGLDTPVDLDNLALGASGDHGVLLAEPGLDRRRRLLAGLPHRLLRREAPAPEVQAHRTHREHDAVAIPDQPGNRLARPRRVDHVQLIRRTGTDQAPGLPLLLGVERSPAADGSATAMEVHGLRTASRAGRHRADHGRARHLARRRRVLQAGAAQSRRHRPSSAFVQRVQWQRSAAVLFHGRSDPTTHVKFRYRVSNDW